MARIIYAVSGEGMGHAIRSKVIIEHLLKKKHDIIIVCGGNAYHFLSKHFDNVYKIECHRIIYKNNQAMHFKTAVDYLRKLPKNSAKNFKELLRIMVKFDPDMVITDFEPFSNLLSIIFRIPVIAIDNILILRKGVIEIPKGELVSYITAKVITYSFNSIKAHKYIITTFFYPERKKPENTVLVPPSLRKEILDAKTRKGKHILVYQTSITNQKLLESLKKIDEEFIIYGFNKEKQVKNLKFREFSEKNFIKDLSSCKAVIVNGGFTVLSEAIYLQKPIFSVPVKKQFEQTLNAIYLEKLGYGEHHIDATTAKIKKFIQKLPDYENNLKEYKQDGNKKLFREVDNTVEEMLTKKRSYIQNIKLINKRFFELLNKLEVIR